MRKAVGRNSTPKATGQGSGHYSTTRRPKVSRVAFNANSNPASGGYGPAKQRSHKTPFTVGTTRTMQFLLLLPVTLAAFSPADTAAHGRSRREFRNGAEGRRVSLPVTAFEPALALAHQH